MRTFFHFFGCFLCFCLMVSCLPTVPSEPKEEEVPVDTLSVMERMEESGTLKAVTNNAILNYRLYDGHPAGFHFELLDDFSELLGLDLQLCVNDSIDECLDLLMKRKIDLFAGVFDTLVADTSFLFIPIDPPVKTEMTFAWVILNRETDTSFLSAIQLWLDDFQGSEMKRSFYRYHNGNKARNDTLFLATDHISRYDDLIKAAAKQSGWDWRLLASIIYQESHFKPDLKSDRGAFGLMQLMPVTMRKYGIDYNSSAEAQLEAGVKILSLFNRELPESITDSTERVNFILASYNAGMGHVLEARHRAEKHGKDPNLWVDNVEYYTPKQTYFFVREINKRYSHYKNLIE